MDWKMFWRIVTTPSCWLRNSPSDSRCDELIRYLLNNKERAQVEFDKHKDGNGQPFYIYIMVDGNKYRLWLQNKWYHYLGRDWGDGSEELMPSRSLCFEFYDAFEKPYWDAFSPEGKNVTFIKPPRSNSSSFEGGKCCAEK